MTDTTFRDPDEALVCVQTFVLKAPIHAAAPDGSDHKEIDMVWAIFDTFPPGEIPGGFEGKQPHRMAIALTDEGVQGLIDLLQQQQAKG